jgi:hypothetical protein
LSVNKKYPLHKAALGQDLAICKDEKIRGYIFEAEKSEKVNCVSA